MKDLARFEMLSLAEAEAEGGDLSKEMVPVLYANTPHTKEAFENKTILT